MLIPPGSSVLDFAVSADSFCPASSSHGEKLTKAAVLSQRATTVSCIIIYSLHDYKCLGRQTSPILQDLNRDFLNQEGA